MLEKIKNSKIFTYIERASLQEKMLNLITVYVVVACMIAVLPFILIRADIRLCFSIAFFGIFSVLNRIYAGISKRVDVASIIYSYVTNMIMLPLLYLFGGGLYGGMPMLFMAGYIVTFLLLDGFTLGLAALLQSLWYVFLLVYSFYFPSQTSYFFKGYNIIIDFLICFVAGAMISTLVLGIYANIYRSIRESIERSKKSVEENGAIKSRFLANMSHELRTPMNAILGMAELLERDEGAAGAHFEISMIKDSAYSLLTTINNVLTYSKLDSKKYELQPQQFSFDKLLENIIYNTNMELSGKNIEFFTDIDPEIPRILYGDEARIREVFQYILFNAIRDTDDGRISMQVGYKRNPVRNNILIRVTVSDTGSGLTIDERQAIFTSFEIYDSRKYSQLKRMGLELTICRDMLELMHGSLRLDSISEVGTSVYFEFEAYTLDTLPLVEIEKNNNSRALCFVTRESRKRIWNNAFSSFGILPDFASTTTALEAMLREKKYDYIIISDYEYKNIAGILEYFSCQEDTYVITDYDHIYGDYGKCRILRRPISCLNMAEIIRGSWSAESYMEGKDWDSLEAPEAAVLVVDDNMVNLKVASGILKKYRINAAIASSGREALSKCEKERYDLILLDQFMPQMDGAETLREIRQLPDPHYASVPIISMTASIGSDVREDMLKAGFQEYLGKPAKAADMEKLLKRFLPGEKLIYKAVERAKEREEKRKDDSVQPGLLTEVGLERMGGSLEDYGEVLNIYYEDGLKKLSEIREYHEQGKTELFVINVHAVKGSSAGVGALEVSELFRQLEMAGKSGDMSFINEHLQEYLDKYASLLETVRSFLQEKGFFKEKDRELDKSPLEEFPFEKLKNILQALEDFDMDSCTELIAQWSGHNYGQRINEHIEKMAEAADSFDYEMTQELAENFPGGEGA